MKRVGRAVRVGEVAFGLGVFAKRWFEPREVIGRIAGAVSDDPGYGSDYCMNLGEGMTLEPVAPFRFLNHSCQPNCDLVFVVRRDEAQTVVRRTMYLQALASIAPEAELTIDYAWPAHFAIPCLCGTAACRGWIVDPDELADVTSPH